jgi:hypothetical protein
MSAYSEFGANLPVHAAGAEQAPAAARGNLGAIISRASFDIKASNARKSRCLYELNRAMKGIGHADMLSEHREGLLRLRKKLARNEAAIQAHLSAVSEVANLLKNAIQNAEADGTYSAGEFGWARS